MTSTTSTHRPTAAADVDGLAVIGQTRHALMGIRYDQGTGGAAPASTGTPSAAGTPTAPAATGTQATQTPAAPANAPENGAQSAETPPAINKATGQPYTAAETAAYIAQIRGEAKTNREAREAAESAKAAAEERTAAILKAAGFNPDGTPYTELDPEEIAKGKAASDRAVDDGKRENLVLRVAPKLEADADKLLDSRSFTNKLSALKSDDKDGVETLVKEWLENEPSYKVSPPAAASSGGTSHAGATPTHQRKSMVAAVGEKIAKNRS